MTKETLMPNAQWTWCFRGYACFKKSRTEHACPGRSADFPVRNNSGTLYGSGKFCNPAFFHAAADWKVRAPFFETAVGAAVSSVQYSVTEDVPTLNTEYSPEGAPRLRSLWVLRGGCLAAVFTCQTACDLVKG